MKAQENGYLSSEWTEVQCNPTCLSSFAGISIHHSARKWVRDEPCTQQHHRLLEVSLATVLWWGNLFVWRSHVNQDPRYQTKGELWEGGTTQGEFLPCWVPQVSQLTEMEGKPQAPRCLLGLMGTGKLYGMTKQ